MSKLDHVETSAIVAALPLKPAPVASMGDAMRQSLADTGKFLPDDTPQDEDPEEAKRQELQQAFQQVAGYVQNLARELHFHIDETLGTTVVTVVDGNTGTVIRQLPAEELLEISRSLAALRDKHAKGLLFRGDA
ncbi:MAG TPA: flagellar protein FlaG [Hyphomicrobiales bacterium]|nr:flagellar protein FlaG [Hyphomicrobiales bacterium]